MDLGFIALLFLVAASGMALWLGRGTPALALLLCLHLGAVIALFATLPYGSSRTACSARHPCCATTPKSASPAPSGWAPTSRIRPDSQPMTETTP